MADQTLARLVNERRVLTLLRINGALTRAEVARRLLLTRATITHVVDDLIQRGLLLENPLPDADRRGRRELGRPGIDVRLAPNGGYFLGVEIGVGLIRLALLDLAVQVVEQSVVECSPDILPDAALDIVEREFMHLSRHPDYVGRIRAIGLTAPGLVRADGFVVHLPILGWKGVNLLLLAERRFSLPVTVENNANAAAFGEVYTRPGLQQDAIVSLKLGTGCGGAAIIKGRLLRGAAGTATEFGHLRIAGDGPLCSCGQHGCLEPSVNLAALKAGFEPSRHFSEAKLRALPARVARLMARGDTAAAQAVGKIADALERGLVTLTNIFNPQVIVLGGMMRPVIEQCLSRLQAHVAAAVVPGMLVPDIRLSHLGDMECAIGAATLAHHDAVDISHLELDALP